MTPQVVGAVHGRTGTYSLKLALERLLGGRCHNMAEIVADPEHHLPLWAPVLRGEDVDWQEVFAGYVAWTDFPGAAFWREVSAAFPDAVVVLSTRPSDDWYRSAAPDQWDIGVGARSSPIGDLAATLIKGTWETRLSRGVAETHER